MEENNNINNVQKCKTRKIGRLTFGITMILFGITVFLQIFLNFDILRYCLMLWPLIFVFLGIEVLYFAKKKDVDLRYDVAGIIMIFVILGIGTIFSIGSFVVNKVLYNEDVKGSIAQSIMNRSETFHFEDNVKIFNLIDKNVKVKITEDKEYQGTIIYIKMQYDQEKVQNDIFARFGEYNIQNIISKDYQNNSLIIKNIPDCLNSVIIEIITNNKNNVTTQGNVTIE